MSTSRQSEGMSDSHTYISLADTHNSIFLVSNFSNLEFRKMELRVSANSSDMAITNLSPSVMTSIALQSYGGHHRGRQI